MRRTLHLLSLCSAAALSCTSDDRTNDPLGGVDPGPCLEGRYAAVECYSGPADTLGVGACRASSGAFCHAGTWVCGEQVIPTEEVCDRVDNDCNGLVDERPEVEVCDYQDNDCDGEVDEGVARAPGECDVACGVPTAAMTECPLPPSFCDGMWLVYFSNATCVDGSCRWQQDRLYCDEGCWDGGCQHSLT